MYTALVLDPDSQQRLVKRFVHLIPAHWKVVAHHMTINMGSIEKGPLSKEDLGKEEEMLIASFAKNDKVMAVEVETSVPSKNAIKHITLAVNYAGGGKPVMSNYLDAWEPVLDPFYLFGTIKEVK